MKLEEFWAKTDPFQSIVTHGLVSGTVACALFRDYLSAGTRSMLAEMLRMSMDQAEMFTGYLTSIHDIGKLEYGFQCRDAETALKLKAEKTGFIAFGSTHYRHELTGKCVLRRIWNNIGEDEDSCDIFSAIIGAHHQKASGLGFTGKNKYFGAFQCEFEQQMRSVFLGDAEENFLPVLHTEQEGALEALLLGIVVLADWISSGYEFRNSEQMCRTQDYRERISQKVEHFLTETGLRPAIAEWGESFHEVWPNIPADGIRPLAQVTGNALAERRDYACMLMEAPMGEGKTEAGVYAALRMAEAMGKDGFYIALPTSATSNQMVYRMRKLLQMHGMTETVRLLHGMAWLIDDQSSGDNIQSEDDYDGLRQWLAPMRRALLGQYAVGTVDQAMLAGSTARYSVLRLLGLSNKVLIIDELHSYDVYMGEFIIRLLEWCKALHIPVVMLSATLPPNLKKKLLSPYTKAAMSDGYPLITAVGYDGAVSEFPINKTVRSNTVSIRQENCLYDPQRIAETAADMVSDGGCLCVLMNTVKQAQKVYAAIRTCYSGDILLFHAQFPAGRRDEIEKECIRKYGKDKSHRPGQSILVATQVVEQSLDVDFDAMITAVAPIDLLIQRMGRIFRHDETVRPASMQHPLQVILVPEDGQFQADKYVYPECLLNQTIHILTGRNQVRIPEDLAKLVADGYDENKVPESEIEVWRKQQEEDALDAGKSRKFLQSPPQNMYAPLYDYVYQDDHEQSRLSVKTRLGEPSQRIALLEPELYAEVMGYAQEIDDSVRIPISDRKLAAQVLQQSISIRQKKINALKGKILDTSCDKLLTGVRIFPSVNGCYKFDGGSICFDHELGIIISEGE